MFVKSLGFKYNWETIVEIKEFKGKIDLSFAGVGYFVKEVR